MRTPRPPSNPGPCDILSEAKNLLYLRILLLSALFFALPGPNGTAQELRVAAKADSNTILIGDWLHVRFEVRHPEGSTVRLAGWADTLAGIEVLQHDSLRQSKSANDLVEQFGLTVTSYDTGTFVIPPLRVRMDRGTDSSFAESSPIPVFVHGVGADTTKDIKDIKKPVAPGISFAEILPYSIGLVVAAVIVWLIVYIVKKRRKGEPILPAAPPRPAREVALEALRSLESEGLWQRGLAKQYHSELSDIIRVYLEGRTNMKAMEMITDEILDDPRVQALDPDARKALKEILTLADFVKFAKYNPIAAENEKSLASAYVVVEKTSGEGPVVEQAVREVELKA